MPNLADGCAARNGESNLSKGFIRGYQDLEVYNNSYAAMLLIYQNIIPGLPPSEADLIDQLRRSCKAVPRLIAEGHSKRHQLKGFQKYIDDAMAESNETNVSLCQVRDICAKFINRDECEKLINLYDKISRQLYKLAIAWQKFSNNRISATRKLQTIPVAQPFDVLKSQNAASDSNA